ncbi:TPA: thr operon leader peptide [Pasteurella multocida]|nr:thr operon leader peptide [Pasteurella multocida]HDR1798240.1 thr operon leader peptide [Pasteurella multocida]
MSVFLTHCFLILIEKMNKRTVITMIMTTTIITNSVRVSA